MSQCGASGLFGSDASWVAGVTVMLPQIFPMNRSSHMGLATRFCDQSTRKCWRSFHGRSEVFSSMMFISSPVVGL